MPGKGTGVLFEPISVVQSPIRLSSELRSSP